MQIKTTMRYYFSPVIMTIIKKTKDDKCWWRCARKGTLYNCWWECMESMVISQKAKNRVTNLTSRYLSGRNEIRIQKKYLRSYVHCSIIHNSKMETSACRWKDKKDVVYVYMEIHGSTAKRKREVLPFATKWMNLYSITEVK